MKNPFKDLFKKGIKDNARSVIQRDEQGHIIGTIDIDRYFGVFDSAVLNTNLITLFNEIAEIQYPIRAIAERALNADIYLKDFNTDSIIWKNKQVNKLLSQPNELESFDKFFLRMLVYYLLIGDTYIYSHIPGSLRSIPRWEACNNYYVLPSDKIQIKTPDKLNLYNGAKKSEIIQGYKLKDGQTNRIFPTDDVLHLSDINMSFDKDVLSGRSRIESLKYPISNLIAVYEARNVIYTKRGALGMVVSKKKDISGSLAFSKTERDQILEDWHGTHGLTHNKSNIAVSNVDLDFVNIGISIKDLEPFKETLNDAVQIAGIFGVPPDLIPREDKSTFNNQKSAEVSLYANTVIPITNRIIDAWNSWLGFEEFKGGAYLSADFSKIPCLQEDKTKMAELNQKNSDRAIKEFNEGVITYNEMRIACGYEKVDNGDYYFWESNNARGIKINNNDTETA